MDGKASRQTKTAATRPADRQILAGGTKVVGGRRTVNNITAGDVDVGQESGCDRIRIYNLC